MTPEEEAAFALDTKVSRDGLSPGAQAEYDRQLAQRIEAAKGVGRCATCGGTHPLDTWPIGHQRDPGAGSPSTDTPASVEKESWSARVANTFPGIGVRARNGEVYPYPTLSQPALGPVEGARAEITDPTKAQMVRAGLASGLAFGAVFGPLALAPGLLRKSKAVAFVVCANGKVHERKLNGTAAIRAAQRDAVKFNVFAGSATAPAPVPAQPPSPPTAGERLAEVTRLHNEGLLTDEEYQAKRAEIIRQL
jgi:hypothetical protein